MEGGERKKTRRERWWDEGERVNPLLVERTGGEGWGELVEEQQRRGEGSTEGSITDQGTLTSSQGSMASS